MLFVRAASTPGGQTGRGLDPHLAGGFWPPDGFAARRAGALSIMLGSDASITQYGNPEADGRSAARRFGPTLLLWMTLVLALNAIRWGVGFPTGALTAAIEHGAARVESRGKGETSEELIRKSIRNQRNTLPFWSTVFAIADLVLEPLILALRAALVATLFTSLAALTGRTVQYDRALVDCSQAQGLWVLGLAVRVALLVCLRRGEEDVDTSLALLLPSGSYLAAVWLLFRQFDVFAILGWGAMASLAWRRGDASLPVATAICLVLGAAESGARAAAALVLGAAMRLTIVVK